MAIGLSKFLRPSRYLVQVGAAQLMQIVHRELLRFAFPKRLRSCCHSQPAS
jgi:hypothetical protein